MKPEPVAKQTVCSLCGLGWDEHVMEANGIHKGNPKVPSGETPTVETCIKLLKTELAKRPPRMYGATGPTVLYSHGKAS